MLVSHKTMNGKNEQLTWAFGLGELLEKINKGIKGKIKNSVILSTYLSKKHKCIIRG